jgi:hypothetical protein
VVFCQSLFAKCLVNTTFVDNILFTDEAAFASVSIVKFHDTHVWVDDNPHITVASRHQHRFSINVWVGILGQQLLGSVVLPNILIDAVYHHFLTIDLSVFFEHVPLHQGQHIWFMHDGAPSNFLLTLRQRLFRRTVDTTRRPSQLACTIS